MEQGRGSFEFILNREIDVQQKNNLINCVLVLGIFFFLSCNVQKQTINNCVQLEEVILIYTYEDYEFYILQTENVDSFVFSIESLLQGDIIRTYGTMAYMGYRKRDFRNVKNTTLQMDLYQDILYMPARLYYSIDNTEKPTFIREKVDDDTLHTFYMIDTIKHTIIDTVKFKYDESITIHHIVPMWEDEYWRR